MAKRAGCDNTGGVNQDADEIFAGGRFWSSGWNFQHPVHPTQAGFNSGDGTISPGSLICNPGQTDDPNALSADGVIAYVNGAPVLVDDSMAEDAGRWSNVLHPMSVCSSIVE